MHRLKNQKGKFEFLTMDRRSVGVILKNLFAVSGTVPLKQVWKFRQMED